MEGTIILLGILGLIYYFYYEQIYKRTKNYKQKQIISLEQATNQLLNNNASALEEMQLLLDRSLTQREQAKFTEELDGKNEKEISEMMKKLMQSKKSNLTDKAIAQRIMILIHQFQRTKLKYVRLMERLQYKSIDDQLKATQDWNYYVRLFFDQASADRIHLVLVTFEEIEKRFDEKLKDSDE